jgi:hypothetical protein
MFKRCLHFLKNRISKLTHQIPPPSPPARTPRDWDLGGGDHEVYRPERHLAAAVCPSNFSIVHHSEERMFAGFPEDAILKPYSPSSRSESAVSDSSSDEEQVIIFKKKFLAWIKEARDFG